MRNKIRQLIHLLMLLLEYIHSLYRWRSRDHNTPLLANIDPILALFLPPQAHTYAENSLGHFPPIFASFSGFSSPCSRGVLVVSVVLMDKLLVVLKNRNNKTLAQLRILLLHLNTVPLELHFPMLDGTLQINNRVSVCLNRSNEVQFCHWLA